MCVLCFVSQVFPVYEHNLNNSSWQFTSVAKPILIWYIFIYNLACLTVTEIDLQKYCNQIWSNMNNITQKYSFPKASLMKDTILILLFYFLSFSKRGQFELICLEKNDFSFLSGILTLNIKCVLTQSCPSLCGPMDCSPPGFSALGISQEEYWNMGSCVLLQGIFLTQGSNPGLLRWQACSLPLVQPGKPRPFFRPM